LLADLDIHEAVPSGSFFAASELDVRYARNIAPSIGVSASGVRHCRFDEPALLAHDLAHKHPFKSRPSRITLWLSVGG
jgi:hypothetical protein